MTAAMLTPQRPPPEDYYQNNWRTLLQFVASRHRELLTEDEWSFVNELLAMSNDAQRLCARLLTRKGPLIREDSLNYAEVTNLLGALTELERLSVITRSGSAPADAVLNLLRKAELLELFSSPGRRQHQKQRKAELCATLLGQHTDRVLCLRVASRIPWLCLQHRNFWRLVKLLYFGDTEQDWSAFVLRDLGMVRYESLPMSTPRFTSRRQLDGDLYSRHLSWLSRRTEEFPHIAHNLATELQNVLTTPATDRFVDARRRRTLYRLGQWHEKQRAVAPAVEAYAAAAIPPARERIVRTLHRAGHTDDANRWLEEIRKAPASEEERQFAERFGKRGAGYQPEVRIIDIETSPDDVESEALDLLLEPGQWGAHVENSLIRSLTGLLYWEAVFADIPGAFTNPFQFAPSDLYSDDFVAVREPIIHAIEVRSDTHVRRALLQTASDKNGIACSLINWQMLESLGLSNILEAMPIRDMRRIGAFLIRNLANRRAGLPDLFICRGPGHYELVEVKGPTDQLQPGQRIWFAHLERLGIPAYVLKLRLRLSPPDSPLDSPLDEPQVAGPTI